MLEACIIKRQQIIETHQPVSDDMQQTNSFYSIVSPQLVKWPLVSDLMSFLQLWQSCIVSSCASALNGSLTTVHFLDPLTYF